MPIIAVCPYCQTGRVRAPKTAVGRTAACPRCHASFTVVDSGETEEEARDRVSAVTSVPIYRPMSDPEPPAPDKAPTAACETTALITVPRPQPLPAPSPAMDDDDETEGRDPARVATIIAFLLAGVGLIAAQLPYGRFGTVGACLIGGLLATITAFGSRLPTYPIAAAILNALTLLVALLLPSWLGLESWQPPPAAKETRTVQVLDTEGLSKPQSDWLDINQTWQFDDVRAKASAAIGQVELIGPKGQPGWSKKSYIQVRIRVGNVGVARKIKFDGWDPAAVKLTDSAGTAVPPAKFEPGWTHAEFSKPAPSLLPGKSADWLLLFELPTNSTEYFRVEFPGAPAGVPVENPIRFQIPARPLGYRPR